MGNFVLTLFFMVSFCDAFAQRDSVNAWISKINNRSIRGTCHYAWVIEPTTAAVGKLITAGRRGDQYLEKKMLSLLIDERKGVIAHFILSNIYDKQDYTYEINQDSTNMDYTYNGLKFTETNYGMVADRLDLENCKRDWARKLIARRKQD